MLERPAFCAAAFMAAALRRETMNATLTTKISQSTKKGAGPRSRMRGVHYDHATCDRPLRRLLPQRDRGRPPPAHRRRADRGWRRRRTPDAVRLPGRAPRLLPVADPPLLRD